MRKDCEFLAIYQLRKEKQSDTDGGELMSVVGTTQAQRPKTRKPY